VRNQVQLDGRSQARSGWNTQNKKDHVFEEVGGGGSRATPGHSGSQDLPFPRISSPTETQIRGVRYGRSPQEMMSTPFKKSLHFCYFKEIPDIEGDQTCKITGLYQHVIFDPSKSRSRIKPLPDAQYERNRIGKRFCLVQPGDFSRKT